MSMDVKVIRDLRNFYKKFIYIHKHVSMLNRHDPQKGSGGDSKREYIKLISKDWRNLPL